MRRFRLPSWPPVTGGAPSDVHRGERLVWLLAAVLLALTWFAVYQEGRHEREREIAEIARNNLNLARVVEEHTVRTLRSVDQAVLFAKVLRESGTPPETMSQYLRSTMQANPIFNQLGVIDEAGIYRLSSLASHKPIDLSDREHFKVHVDKQVEGLFVSKPVLGRASGKWSIQLTRRVEHPDGGFAGVVVSSIDPFYLTSLYSDINLGERGVIALVGDDGVVRARRAADDTGIGQPFPNTNRLRQFRDEGVGHYASTSSFDGVTRYYAFRHLKDYPLTVMVGVGQAEAMADADARARNYWLFGGFFSLLIVAGAIAATIAIGRERAIAERLKVSQTRAEEANRLKSEFLASMSHELRTPMNGIIGYAEFLRDQQPEGTTEREFSQVILDSGRHLLDLLNSLLDLSKIEAGKLELSFADESAANLAQQALAAQRAVATAKGLLLDLYVDPMLPPAFRCDRLRVLQVLHNLLHNAVKFTDAGRVTLRVVRSGDLVRFSVIDTGCGIAPEHQALVFERFRQAERFITRRYGGTGLGLALASELVTRMGGRLELQSTPGRGSEFSFALPLTDASGGPARAGAAPAVAAAPSAPAPAPAAADAATDTAAPAPAGGSPDGRAPVRTVSADDTLRG